MAIEPVKWNGNQEQLFKQYIHYELQIALQGRQSLERQWREWLTQYRAPAKQPLKRFPFEGAANYMLPVTATDVDQLYAKFMQTIHAPDNLWTLAPLNERWVDAAKPMQDFMEWLDHFVLKMWDVDKRVVMEMCKLGTGVYKHGWLYERRPYRTYDQTGRIVNGTRIRSQPFVDHVRLADLIIPTYSYHLQPDHQGGAPWIAERQRIDRHKFKWQFQSANPMLPKEDQDLLTLIENFYTRTQTIYDQKVQDLDYLKHSTETLIDFDKSSSQESTANMGRANGPSQQVEIYEIHARFDTKGDGSQDDVICWYHQPTMTVLRPIYNYFLHGQRPYDAIRYFPGEGFYGIGVCEQKEMFQKSQSELFNFTYDNVLLGNSIQIATKAGSNIVPGEPIYPSKIWITDGDPDKEFKPFTMGSTHANLPQLHELVATLGERRTGISDIQLGSIENLPGRTPAATMQSLLAEGSRRPDLTVKDMRYEGLSMVGLRVLQNCQQFLAMPSIAGDTRVLQWATDVLGSPEGQAVTQKLSTPMENVESGVGVTLTATSGSANKDQMRQDLAGLLQLAGQLYPQFVQGAGVMMQSQPGTPVYEMAQDSLRGLTELFKRLLEQYDIRNPEELVPQMAPPTGAPAAGGAGSPPVGLNVGPGGATGSAPFNPAMAQLLQLAGAGR